MGFYLNMLRESEEFVDTNDFNSDIIGSSSEYSAELNDIAAAVNDMEDDRAKESSTAELVGQDLAEDPIEECYQSLYEAEYNWAQIMMAVGTKELNEMASGGNRRAINENALTDFFEKVKKFFVNLFKKITAFFKNWLDNALVVFRTNDSFVKKYGGKLDSGKKAFEAGDKTIKGYQFNKVKANRDKVLKYLENISKQKSDVANNIKGCIDAIKNNNNSAIENLQKDFDSEKLNTFRGELCGVGGSVESSDFKSKLKESLFGSEDKEELNTSDLNSTYIQNVLKNSKNAISDAKKMYEGVKSYFKNAINATESVQKAINNIKEKNDSTSNAGTLAQKMMNCMKDQRSACYIAFNMAIKSIKAEQAQARKIGNAYIMALNKGDRKKTIDALESTSYFGNIQMI